MGATISLIIFIITSIISLSIYVRSSSYKQGGDLHNEIKDAVVSFLYLTLLIVSFIFLFPVYGYFNFFQNGTIFLKDFSHNLLVFTVLKCC